MIVNMRGRLEQCRRLAKSINDPRAIESLLQLAREIEADVKRLEAERDAY